MVNAIYGSAGKKSIGTNPVTGVDLEIKDKLAISDHQL